MKPSQGFLSTLFTVLFTLPLGAQSVTESYSPGSPIPPPYDAADIVVAGSNRIAGGIAGSGDGVLYSRTALGIPPGGNIDAFADGLDVFPPLPPTGGAVGCRWLVIEYTVTPGTIGIPGTPINLQALGNGAASDTFAVTATAPGGFAGPFLRTDALGVPQNVDLDALIWHNNRSRPVYPVWYSVDAPTATLLSAAWAPAVFSEGDIIMQTMPGGTPIVFLSRAVLGLVPGDDIDALAVMVFPFAVVLSLSRTSPTANGGMAISGATMVPVRPGGLYLNVGPAPLTLYASDVTLGLGGPTGGPDDDLNGVRITDPFGDPPGPGMPGAGGYQGLPPGSHSSILVDNVDGGDRRIVDLGVGQTLHVAITPPPYVLAGTPATVMATLGIPCLSAVQATPFGNLAFLDLSNLVTVPTPFAATIPAGFPLPITVTLQGAMADPVAPGGFGITNALAICVF